MLTHPVRRVLTALLVASGLLATAAAPASATPVVLLFDTPSSITIGSLTLDVGGVNAGQTCSPNGVQNQIDPDVSGGVIDLQTTDWTTVERDLVIGATTLRVQIVPTANTLGSISGSTVLLPVQFSIIFRSCAGATLCETNPISVSPLSDSGYTGSNPPVSGDTMSLSGTSAATVTTKIGCNTIIRALLVGNPANVLLSLLVP